MAQGWDQTVFNRTLLEYRKVTSRTTQFIINTKAYYIARKAIWFTRKADSHRIKGQLGQMVSVNRIGKRGKIVKKRVLNLVKSTRVDAPLAALIINARAKEGEGKFGSAMARAIRDMLAARQRSVAFLKSGWLEAVRKLAPLAEKRGQPATDTSAKRIGRAKGDAKPAQNSSKPIAQIVNLATTRRDNKGALIKVGTPGIEKAFKDETSSMVDYIRQKMKPDAEAFNRKQG